MAATAVDVARLIETGRAALKPTPVKPGVPVWLAALVRKHYGMRNQGCPNEMILSESLRKEYSNSRESNDDWLDHHGTTVIKGRECFVSEPYVEDALTKLKQVDAFCSRLGLKYYVSPNSWHFPGFTFRIIILNPES